MRPSGFLPSCFPQERLLDESVHSLPGMNGTRSRRVIVVEAGAGRQACGGACGRRCWQPLDVSGVPGLLPDLPARTQGLLAEARLTLGYDPQPLQGWCEGRKFF